MITLHQFAPAFGLPNASPFCMKLETWLRMAKLEFTIPRATLRAFRSAPMGKLPYIEEEGQVYADSSLIIDHLTRRHGITLDDWLSADQRAEARACQKLMEDSLYWSMVYTRWIDPDGWALTQPTFFGALPAPLKWFVPALARRGTRTRLQAQGTGTHRRSDIIAMGLADITALARLLGVREYVLGARPCTLDACAYGFIANLVRVPYENELTQHARSFPSFDAYCDRMQQRYYPDQQPA